MTAQTIRHRRPTRLDRARAQVHDLPDYWIAAACCSAIAAFGGVLWGWWLAQ